jgi:hypothetical protein
MPVSRLVCDQLYANKRNKAKPHALDLLCHPERVTNPRQLIKNFANALLLKNLDDPKTVAFFVPAEYWNVNHVMPLARMSGWDWINRLGLCNEYLGRPYDHYKAIPCIKNLAIQIRCLERAAPEGTFPHDVWRGQAKTSAMFEEMEFVGGSIIAQQARRYVDNTGEVLNGKFHVMQGAKFSKKGSISFSKVLEEVWGPEDRASSGPGKVAGVTVPRLASIYEPGVAPVLQLGDAVRIQVEGSAGGWLVLVTELFEPETVRGSFLCIGTGCRLWTLPDVKADLPGCSGATLAMQENEVLLSPWTVSFKVHILLLVCHLLLNLCVTSVG